MKGQKPLTVAAIRQTMKELNDKFPPPPRHLTIGGLRDKMRGFNDDDFFIMDDGVLYFVRNTLDSVDLMQVITSVRKST